MQKKSKYKICRNDCILAAALAAAAVLLLLLFIFLRGSSAGDAAVITVNGQEYGRYSLDKDQTIEINNEYGSNTVVIADGKVHMEHADCPDAYCIAKGSIYRNGDTIVCLPHKLVVEVRMAETSDDDLDAVAE